MDQFEIIGGRPLKGKVSISGSKNAALPCLFATLLTDEPCTLEQIPALADIETSLKLLETLGKKVERVSKKIVISKARALTGHAPYDLVRRMRASVLVMGPLLARRKRAKVSMPGGCAIGARPVNIHLDGFHRMGVETSITEGYVDARTKGLKGALIPMPFPSVGATENLMMAAVLAKGTTIIQNAAREPEIVDLGRMLQKMGASIRGLETSEIIIEGVRSLSGTVHAVIPDRIEAGTFMIAAGVTKGDIFLENVNLAHLGVVIHALKQAGLSLEQENKGVRAKYVKALKPVDIETDVYPGFPTDMQAQWISMMAVTKGKCRAKETVFENRFLHVQELLRFGANISLNGTEDTTCPFADAEEMVGWMRRAKLDVEPHFIAKKDLDGKVFTSAGHPLGNRTQIVLQVASKYLKTDGADARVRRGKSDFERREDVRYRTSGGEFVISYANGFPVGKFEPSLPAVSYVDHTDLTFTLDRKGTKTPIRAIADWDIRRGHILDNMARVMGPFPSQLQRVPLDVKEVEQAKVGDLIRRKITYQSDANDRVSAYIFTPATQPAKKLPAILALHQTTRIGKDEPAGLGVKDAAYGLELAQRGYVVIVPDYPSFAEHKYCLLYTSPSPRD